MMSEFDSKKSFSFSECFESTRFNFFSSSFFLRVCCLFFRMKLLIPAFPVFKFNLNKSFAFFTSYPHHV